MTTEGVVMDPDAALDELRALLALDEPMVGELERMAELMRALDSWLAGGGFLPLGWRRMPGRAT